MALLQLQDIGKIYVSEGNVAVGIRGVNLSFDKGEFVAITGQSGSGKSTLLNVISGMDTYEEGELFIEGQSTSHYLQPEWEEYREKYISFIFQDYNIIESFTVLQNVELALMHIENAKERKKRALELLERVGLSSHIKQKGSQLSGGQKQRTVIARALAKNSPIILADEPTGNLDSQTSKEIIALLKEVSKDKLLIVVTHNFEDVEAHATRHVRVFDGAVESDHVIERPTPMEEKTSSPLPQTKKKELVREIKNGFSLGKSIFFSKPKLSTFLCLLMIVGALGIYLITSLLNPLMEILFEPNYIFHNIEGRVVATVDDGSVLTDEELSQIAEQYGATHYLRNDYLLDQTIGVQIPTNDGYYQYDDFEVDLLRNYENLPMEGNLPAADSEVVLYLPISYKVHSPTYSKQIYAYISNVQFTLPVSGAIYYSDNNLAPKILFTEAGYDLISSCYFPSSYRSEYYSTNLEFFLPNSAIGETYFSFSFALDKDEVYVDGDELKTLLNRVQGETLTITCFDNSTPSIRAERTLTEAQILTVAPEGFDPYTAWQSIFVSPYLFQELMAEIVPLSYRQFSLFFDNDAQAKTVADQMSQNGFIAVTADATYDYQGYEVILSMISAVFTAFVWVIMITFFGFFINLCTARSMESFKNEMAIMRSMGIRMNAIKLGMFVRMLLALIPAYIAVCVMGVAIAFNPPLNSFFTYLYAWHYVVLFIGLLILSVSVTYNQIKKLFETSVKKSLKGGGVA